MPSPHNWRTTDQDEINRRRARARSEEFRISNADPCYPIFSNFRVHSASGLTYSVEVRDVEQRQFACGCVDFRINGALLHCEERYPTDGPHSVLYVVVERDAAQYREQLGALQTKYFGPGQWDPLCPVRLEVIDRATDEALQHFIDAGLVARTTRATRPLWPAEPVEAAPPPLSAAGLEKLSAHRQRAARKLKMARVLSDAGLSDEARAALLEAVPPLGCALAVQHRFPEPASHNDVLLPPLSACRKEALPLLREFTADAAHPCQPVLEALVPLAEGTQRA